MLTKAQAITLLHQELHNSSRAIHSVLVAYLMGQLAERFGEDRRLWEIVGLCHDLDYFLTASDRSKHGVVAVQMLEGLLPSEALEAIAAHDHRTGITAGTHLAHALKAADALAVIDLYVSRNEMRQIVNLNEDAYGVLGDRLEKRSYLSSIIQSYATEYRLAFSDWVIMLKGSPIQGMAEEVGV